MTWHKVCVLSDLNATSPRKYVVDGIEVLLVLADNAPQRVYAFDNFCSHAEKPMERGPWNPEALEITCPFHRAVFLIAEGGKPKGPPACSPIGVYDCKVDGNAVSIDLD